MQLVCQCPWKGAPRSEWLVLSKRCNTAGERFPARPEGATQIIQYGVTALEKGLAIPGGLCLVLDYLGSSEHGNITLKEYCTISTHITSQTVIPMNDNELSREERILRVMRRVLTSIAKDTYTRPGHRHPLSDETVDDIRHCLGLIAAREGELNTAAGRGNTARPRFIDEPQSSVVVPLDIPGKEDKDKK